MNPEALRYAMVRAGQDVYKHTIDLLNERLISRETALYMLGVEPGDHPEEGATVAPPKNATSKDGIRAYDWQGQTLISVTSLRKVLGLPYPLAIWMKKKVAERGVLDMSGAADILAREGADAAIKWLMAAPDEERDAAGDRGTAVHDLAERGIPANHPDVPDELRGWLRQYEMAIAAEGIEPILRERQVFSPTLGYAGSFDIIGARKGKVTLIDLKTSKGTYVDHALQLYGYAHADFIGQDGLIDKEATEVLNSVEALGILHVQETSWSYIEVPISGITKAAWFHLVALARFYLAYPNLSDLPGSR